METDGIREILAAYAKHGWTLRRVLLSDAARARLADKLTGIFGGVEIVFSDLDALWFSRMSNQGEAWELRHLGASPFALIEVFNDDDAEADRLAVRRETEIRMSEKLRLTKHRSH